jgi:hypothetical protein
MYRSYLGPSIARRQPSMPIHLQRLHKIKALSLHPSIYLLFKENTLLQRFHPHESRLPAAEFSRTAVPGNVDD